MSSTTFEDHALGREKGYSVNFIAGWSKGEVRIEEDNPVVLKKWEDRKGDRFFVSCGLGGGQDGYRAHAQTTGKSPRQYRTMKWWDSLEEAQAELDQLAAKRQMILVSEKTHPNCISTGCIRACNRWHAMDELWGEFCHMPMERLLECFPDGRPHCHMNPLTYTEKPDVDFFIDIVHSLIRMHRPISDDVLFSLLRRPERIPEHRECYAGELAAERHLVKWVEHFYNIKYLSHQPDMERDARFRMGSSNWECMSPSERAEGVYFRELYVRVQGLWQQVQREGELAA